MSKTLVHVDNIFKEFKKSKVVVPVLKGVSFSVQSGESVAIVGSSGAGKSTLMHILGTLEHPTSGKVSFEGKNIFAMNDDQRSHFRNRNIGFVFQAHYLLPEFTALENVMMPGLIAGRSESTLKPEALGLLKEVGLDHRAGHKPGELSGGESQRVAVARALMMKPPLLLADELTGNLDSDNGHQLISLLLNLNQTRGVTLVIVTHDADVAKRMSRVVEMRDGRIYEVSKM